MTEESYKYLEPHFEEGDLVYIEEGDGFIDHPDGSEQIVHIYKTICLIVDPNYRVNDYYPADEWLLVSCNGWVMEVDRNDISHRVV